MKEYPIYVNKEMMKAERITPESFWAEDGIYRASFLDAPQGAAGTEEEFNQLNDRLFQIKIICIFTFGIMNLRIIIIMVVIGMVLMCGQCMTKKESDLLFLMLYWYWIELLHNSEIARIYIFKILM